MSRFELILLCLCMGACTARVPPVDPLALAGLHGAGYELISDAQRFRAVAVGQALYGDGYRAVVEPGGTLTGLYAGQPFNGVWVFTEDGRYCQSLTQQLSGPASNCYWIAVRGDDIRLISMPAQQG